MHYPEYGQPNPAVIVLSFVFDFDQQAQERVLGGLIEVAKRHDLPLILHTRKREVDGCSTQVLSDPSVWPSCSLTRVSLVRAPCSLA